MIQRNVVLVLGAGASYDYGYPLGQQLRQQVIAPSQAVRGALHQAGHKQPALDYFCDEMRLSNLASIDAFLARRQNLAPLGRAMIAATILQHEASIGYLTGGWYEYLFQELMKNVTTPAEFLNNNLSVVTFNYDTSFERYMVNALRATFDLSLDNSTLLFKHVRIVHVHGMIPAVPAGQFLVPSPFVPESIATLQDKIITLHQGVEDSEEFVHARKLLADSEAVFFLGFGYHSDNVRRLQVTSWLGKSSQALVGGVMGLVGDEVGRVQAIFSHFQKAYLSDGDCLSILRNKVGLFDPDLSVRRVISKATKKQPTAPNSDKP